MKSTINLLLIKDKNMRNTDLSPLYRSFIGFDHLASLMDAANRSDKSNGFPPYNIESVSKDNYRITMAVAGFDNNEIDITSEQNTLLVKGTKANKSDGKTFIYQGIAERNFERKFQLGDHVKVNGASMENGLLHIELEREIPDALKSRKIEIKSSNLINA
jgi:molecular chaperone IbpA